MFELRERFFGRARRSGSASNARERLRFVLFHDRIDLSPKELNKMKTEILAVIARYVSIESDRVDIALQQRQRDSLIVAEVPFSRPTQGAGHSSRDLDENDDSARV